MVNLVHLDQTWACVLDNNYIGERQLVWMSVAEFVSRWKGQGQGWAVVLLDPPPMPAPHN
jgi:23S rRNA G2069 N7-methylase RlmK/C1962 C5-methylase RlmI